jgi:hypothetical protein
MPPDTDPVAAAAEARTAHKATCAACGDQAPCTRLGVLTAAWRQARLEAAGQITTTPATR